MMPKPSVRRGWSAAPVADPVFKGKAEGNYEIEYRRLREQGLSAERAQKIASTVASSRAATTKSQEITHATFDVNKGGMQKAQAKPGGTNSEVIANSQARLASGTRTPDEATWDRKLIQASKDRMKITGENPDQGIMRPKDTAAHQQSLFGKTALETRATRQVTPITTTQAAEIQSRELSASAERSRAVMAAKVKEPDRIALNAAKVANSSAAMSSVVAPAVAPISTPPKAVVSTPEAITTSVHPDIAAFEKKRAEERRGYKPDTSPITVKTGPIKDVLRSVDSKVRENFSDYEDSEKPTSHSWIDPDKVRKDIKYAEKRGDSSITTKIPSYSEIGLSYTEAHAILAKEDGLTESQFNSRLNESVAKANQSRVNQSKPTELKGTLNGKPFTHVFATGADANDFAESAWDVKIHSQTVVETPPKQLPTVQAAVQEKLAEIAQKRTKLENQVQKALANPDRSKLPADPFQGFHGEHPATSSLTGQVPEKILMKGGKPMTDKQKEGLAKAHAAIRAKAAAKKAAAGGEKKFDAIRGGGSGGSGSFEQLHPRVPSGNSKGGQWTKK